MKVVNVFLIFSVLLALFGSTASAQTSASRPPFRYGIIVSNTSHLPQAAGLGFGWVKIYVSWKSIEPTKGSFSNYPDNVIQQAQANNLQVVASIFDIPDYEAGSPAPSAMPSDFGDFMGQLAAHFKGQIGAYEIWNEPNVSGTWGWGNPDASVFTSMIKAAYPKVKQADPSALVISGGLSNTLNGNGTSAISDLTYIQQMVQDGIVGNVDAIGIHPYPGPCDPSTTTCGSSGGVMFRRAEQEHDALVQAGGGSIPMWITEAGYFSTPSDLGSNFSGCNGSGSGIGGFASWELDPNTKANDLVAAFQYAYNNWPWLGGFILMNLDMTTDTFRATCDPVRFWAILDQNGNPTPSYTALQQMTKFAPQISFPQWSSTNQVSSPVTISGLVTDPTTNGNPGLDAVVASVDTPYLSSSVLAPSTFSSNGSFTINVDVSHLSYGVVHLIHVYIHTAAEGWTVETVGVTPAAQAGFSPASLTFILNPSVETVAQATITVSRNDGNSQPFSPNPTVSSGTSWLTAVRPMVNRQPDPWHITVTANAAGLSPGIYHAMVTVSDQSSSSWLQNLPVSIPVTLLISNATPRVYIPAVEDGTPPG